MKAVMETCVRVPGLKSDSRLVKAGKADHFDSHEMKACFSKLQQLVPTTCQREGRMDKTELLQCVIDYIMDLEDTLVFTSKSDSSSRQPLAEKSADMNIKMAGGDLLSSVPAALASLEDLDFRPPSK